MLCVQLRKILWTGIYAGQRNQKPQSTIKATSLKINEAFTKVLIAYIEPTPGKNHWLVEQALKPQCLRHFVDYPFSQHVLRGIHVIEEVVTFFFHPSRMIYALFDV